MIQIKRIEIVVDASNSERVTDLLEDFGLTGWTLLRGATGFGERGHQRGDGITDDSTNNLVISTCPPEQIDDLVARLKPLLSKFGGMCLVSDAQWLPH